MNERIREFLSSENKSSAQLAEEIGVQPSGISHILSGRNNPSLDFVLKMLEKYDYLSNDWLLFGKGSMYKTDKGQTLFDETVTKIEDKDSLRIKSESYISDSEFIDNQKDVLKKSLSSKTSNKTSLVEKIVWFYDDNSFEEYFPSR